MSVYPRTTKSVVLATQQLHRSATSELSKNVRTLVFVSSVVQRSRQHGEAATTNVAADQVLTFQGSDTIGLRTAVASQQTVMFTRAYQRSLLTSFVATHAIGLSGVLPTKNVGQYVRIRQGITLIRPTPTSGGVTNVAAAQTISTNMVRTRAVTTNVVAAQGVVGFNASGRPDLYDL